MSYRRSIFKDSVCPGHSPLNRLWNVLIIRAPILRLRQPLSEIPHRACLATPPFPYMHGYKRDTSTSNQAVPLPDDVDLPVGAMLGIPAMTA